MNALEGQQDWCKRPRKLFKTSEVIRPYDEDERRAHTCSENNAPSQKNATCDTPGKAEEGAQT